MQCINKEKGHERDHPFWLMVVCFYRLFPHDRKKMGDQLRDVLYRESLALCKGRVVKKYIQDGENLVDLAVTLEDHDGKFMIPNGSATVVLPSRKMEKGMPYKY